MRRKALIRTPPKNALGSQLPVRKRRGKLLEKEVRILGTAGVTVQPKGGKTTDSGKLWKYGKP